MALPIAALEKLRDIHPPQPIGWWPLAPGWYLLFIITVVVLTSLIWSMIRYIRHGQAKREALSCLTHYEAAYKIHQCSEETSAQIVELLKQVALVYFPREQVAALHGHAWLSFLNDTSQGLDFFTEESALLICPYQTTSHQDLRALFQLTRSWIRQRRKPCLS